MDERKLKPLNYNESSKQNDKKLEVEENILKLKQLFPSVVKDGQLDVEALKNELGVYEESDVYERYQFTWKGKQEARQEAQKYPEARTLKLCEEDSKNIDTTENLYIEGDNLEVLKLLKTNYYGQVKMIYIDPPYNTGKDFIYKDNFKKSKEESEEEEGYTEDGNRMQKNENTNANYHSNWLNMMYPRLKVAYQLLSDDGVIFISIDDNEVANLRKMCDEVFGEDNFIASFIWEKNYAPKNNAKYVSENHDFVLFYAKNLIYLPNLGLPRTVKMDSKYKNPDNDPRGLWRPNNLSASGFNSKGVYKIVTPNGRVCYPPNGNSWRYSEDKFKELLKDNRIYFGKDGNGIPVPKIFLSEVKDTSTPLTIWKYQDVGHTDMAYKLLKSIFDGSKFFDYPKPIQLIKRMLQLSTSPDSLVLDFFSGSATTAHAVMELNAEDGGNRKFIMVQIPESCDVKSEAYKAGYTNICEIGKERIRRAGDKILKELQEKHEKYSIEQKQLEVAQATNSLLSQPTEDEDGNPIQQPTDLQKYVKEPSALDIGFRVLKVDSSNIKNIIHSNDIDKLQLELNKGVNLIKPDRTELDLVFEIILKMGLSLNAQITEKEFQNKKLYVVENTVICLDYNITSDIADQIINKYKPIKIIFKDNSFATSKDKLQIMSYQNIEVRVIENIVRG